MEEDGAALPILVVRARELPAPPDPGTAFGARYLRVTQHDPAVVIAHGDVVAALAATREDVRG